MALKESKDYIPPASPDEEGKSPLEIIRARKRREDGSSAVSPADQPASPVEGTSGEGPTADADELPENPNLHRRAARHGPDDSNRMKFSSSTFNPGEPPFEQGAVASSAKYVDGGLKSNLPDADDGLRQAEVDVQAWKSDADNLTSENIRWANPPPQNTEELSEKKESGASNEKAVQPSTARDPKDVPTRLLTDKPTDHDSLGFDAYAGAIAQFLLDEASKPPLTISIQAPWGGGKTSMMLMIEGKLDPKETRVPKSQGRPEDDKLTVRDLEQELNDGLKGRHEPLPKIRPRSGEEKRRTTVWFNAWKYENTNQVWAGLVDAILQQVPQRLSRRERERFWLRLNLSRVDCARIRQSLHEYFINRVVRSAAGLTWAIAAAAVSFIGSATGIATLAKSPAPATFGVSAFVAVMAGVVAKWVAANFEFKQEAAAEMFKNIVRAPSYDTELGFVHQAESDLRRVFKAFPGGEDLVIFIDDLDRCSPTKVAAVLEAVNLIIAGDFPDCYFVLGMDAEMVAGALQAAHKDLAAGVPDDARIPIGWRFMDKFVQLPFIVPPIEGAQEKAFLQNIFDEAQGQRQKPGSGPAAPEVSAPPKRASKDVQEFIDLSESLAYLFQGNPRELKRFTNLLRFHWYLWYARSQTLELVAEVRPQGVEAQALAYWTAMSVKWPEYVRWLRRIEARQAAYRTLEAVPDLSDQATKDALSELQALKTDDSSLNNLRVFEALAATDAVSFKMWQAALKSLYGIGDKTPAWLGDSSLFYFYRAMAEKLKEDSALSRQVGRGFW